MSWRRFGGGGHRLRPVVVTWPLAPTIHPASSRSQRWGHVLGLSLGPCPLLTTCNPPRKQRLAAVRWGARVVLGVELSLGYGKPRPCRCCPLVHPVPVIVVPRPRHVLPGPHHCCPRVLAAVVPMSSPLLSPCPCPCSSWTLSLLSSLSSYPPWVVVSSSG